MANKIGRSVKQKTFNLFPHEVVNIAKLDNREIDHVLLLRGNTVYIMIHGCDKGIGYSSYLIDYKLLSYAVRVELNLRDTQYLNLKVLCCYAFYQKEYQDTYTKVSSVFDNEKELYYQLHSNQMTCDFYVA